jgi:curved DNA-binding protein CbpA
MGQIFNRLKDIASSYFSDSNQYSSYANPEDDELRRIIDELNNTPKKENPKNDFNFQKNNSNNNNSAQSNVPANVINAFKIIGISSNSDVETIKAAFKKKIKEHHPDKFQKADDNTKKEAQQYSQDLISAYNIIKQYKGF